MFQEERGKKRGAIFDPARSLTTEYQFLFLKVTPTYLHIKVEHPVEDY
jgi:hypothetical protein